MNIVIKVFNHQDGNSILMIKNPFFILHFFIQTSADYRHYFAGTTIASPLFEYVEKSTDVMCNDICITRY